MALAGHRLGALEEGGRAGASDVLERLYTVGEGGVTSLEPPILQGGGLGLGGGRVALLLPLPLGLALALGLLCWAWRGVSSSLLSKRGFFLGALRWGLGALGGCPPPPAPAAAPAAAAAGPPRPVLHPHPTLALRVHAPRTPARLPPTQTVQHREGQFGVLAHHLAQLGDPHEVRPASAIAPLHAQPLGVGSTCLHADNLRTET